MSPLSNTVTSPEASLSSKRILHSMSGVAAVTRLQILYTLSPDPVHYSRMMKNQCLQRCRVHRIIEAFSCLILSSPRLSAPITPACFIQHSWCPQYSMQKAICITSARHDTIYFPEVLRSRITELELSERHIFISAGILLYPRMGTPALRISRFNISGLTRDPVASHTPYFKFKIPPSAQDLRLLTVPIPELKEGEFSHKHVIPWDYRSLWSDVHMGNSLPKGFINLN